MPYIQKKKRPKLLIHILNLYYHIKNGGELNYCFSMLCKKFIEEHGEGYANYAQCIAALEGAKLELYRRYIAPYENKKIVENGDLE